MNILKKMLSLFIKEKPCEHRHTHMSEETGYYCVDCGAGGWRTNNKAN